VPIVNRPLFIIQIVRTEDGAVARIPGGGPLEANLTELIVSHVMSKGVNWKSRKHVEQDVREGVKDAIMSMKEQTTHINN
jgi:hypothetical protein